MVHEAFHRAIVQPPTRILCLFLRRAPLSFALILAHVCKAPQHRGCFLALNCATENWTTSPRDKGQQHASPYCQHQPHQLALSFSNCAACPVRRFTERRSQISMPPVPLGRSRSPKYLIVKQDWTERHDYKQIDKCIHIHLYICVYVYIYIYVYIYLSTQEQSNACPRKNPDADWHSLLAGCVIWFLAETGAVTPLQDSKHAQ